ncbi:MAG TPA: EVE domain-containing protein [Nitrospirales bacterium]|nr:EVE domain-containing protein [Nitrospirales bacterium]HIB54015.1 EVE domain-containing protein [Nitrospirales bacterium]HIC04008.1 EVE domain-containing protein [Nitrospirales bacterium]HIN33880.1 EVE domain-containing protein [Nitrospirales bacterium]HIO20802.1 EVE domain-containing protein [Nitrospirales bacterium]
MAFWLVKSEPSAYSWDEMAKDRRAPWDGVRNYQAANNMKAMKRGDHVLFYHSNTGMEIVGIIKVVKEHYPDPSDASGRFGMVDMQAVTPVKKPVSLKAVKANPALADLPLVRQSRLSVMPVTDREWKILLRMAETTL